MLSAADAETLLLSTREVHQFCVVEGRYGLNVLIHAVGKVQPVGFTSRVPVLPCVFFLVCRTMRRREAEDVSM